MRRFSGDSFCSDEHREAYTTFMQAVMLDRLRQSAQRLQNAYGARGETAHTASQQVLQLNWGRSRRGDDKSLVARAV
jgi:hypothetical protein